MLLSLPPFLSEVSKYIYMCMFLKQQRDMSSQEIRSLALHGSQLRDVQDNPPPEKRVCDSRWVTLDFRYVISKDLFFLLLFLLFLKRKAGVLLPGTPSASCSTASHLPASPRQTLLLAGIHPVEAPMRGWAGGPLGCCLTCSLSFPATGREPGGGLVGSGPVFLVGRRSRGRCPLPGHQVARLGGRVSRGSR
uniref:Uncharacterized protein n=1 Tax=Myotis myotis TaxID=51298 RepID=A0A7J7SSK5_MYOMY|nr:hypothetical protein mMyoMyo1_009430 [Myotis myotis]